ncbi:MAG: radical SAM protein [Acidobacteriota bacterium]
MHAFDRRLRAQRPAKIPPESGRPIAAQVELERTPEGDLERALTIFLAGRECPFTCIFCDLWRHTTDAPTPPGAIPEQIRIALEEHAPKGAPPVESVKLYNASNFFDAGSVPPADDAKILDLVGGLRRVIVECHAKLVGRRAARYAERLGGAGSRLEVAVGFETVHPQALAQLNKRVTVNDLRAASRRLREMDADLRAFVLIGVPFIDLGDEEAWVLRSVQEALDCGARVVSLIPMRSGESELVRLEREGLWTPPDLDRVEAAYTRARELAPDRVFLDTWDLDKLRRAPGDGRRVERLRGQQLGALKQGGAAETAGRAGGAAA